MHLCMIETLHLGQSIPGYFLSRPLNKIKIKRNRHGENSPTLTVSFPAKCKIKSLGVVQPFIFPVRWTPVSMFTQVHSN